ncbi:hypothetical protein [Calidifontibacillus erzurumensis]|uniref:Uncharacterized protein n=1 Tax=Calidifontibacillus erzurumensis TaxID=2741433 RepID=A0A8J8KBK8_9BACI|nr:hypothetical protein [Calidifontibacillus erzurumensis]NSL51158.1 hypothetical protein [Calidifontibacillus erzurumensis]
MSLKLVELQVALPRTQDFAKMELEYKGQHVQQQMASLQQKEDLKKRNQVNKYGEANKNRVVGDGHDKKFERNPQSKKKQARQKSKSTHPYKGNFLDIEG